MESEDLVFISYAREDKSWAERLYMDLRKHEINAWLDIRCLAAGVNWKYEIKRAIRDSRYFILLLSKHSINKRGFVQKEIKEAIDVLQEFPKNSIFLIPARLDNTDPIDEKLKDLNWVDLATNYSQGLSRILSSLTAATKSPLITTGTAPKHTVPTTFIDKGREITLEMPLLIGPRAAINYAPFRSREEFIHQFIDRLPTDSIFADRSFSYYITLETPHDDVLIGDDLKDKYPEFITLVLQNGYRSLEARLKGFSVIMAFNGVERTIGIPYHSIRIIRVPELGIAISLDSSTVGNSVINET